MFAPLAMSTEPAPCGCSAIGGWGIAHLPGRVDGFGEDECGGESDDGCEVSLVLLAA